MFADLFGYSGAFLERKSEVVLSPKLPLHFLQVLWYTVLQKGGAEYV